MTVGIIAIVLGALGVGANALGAASALTMTIWVDSAATNSPVFEAISAYQPAQLAHAAMATLLSAVLAAGGIGLVARRRWSIATLRGWSVAKFVVVPVGAALAFMMQRAQFEAMQNDPQFAASTTAMPWAGAMAGLFGLFALAWGMALPVFILVWLGRRRVKAETAEWR